MQSRRVLALLGLLSFASACGHSVIAGTEIKNTEQNREVYAVVQQVVAAIQARDADALIALVSPRYFEDNATADQNDDYGYNELKDRILPEAMKVAKEIQLEVKVFDIKVEDGHAMADLRYHSRAQLALPTGTIWDSHKEFDRLEFACEGGQWRIIRGL